MTTASGYRVLTRLPVLLILATAGRQAWHGSSVRTITKGLSMTDQLAPAVAGDRAADAGTARFRSTRAERMSQPLARDVVKMVAVEHGACIRPVQFSARQRRELKHRPRGETRPVPIHPDLVGLISQHLKRFPPRPDGRIFTGPRGGIFNDRAYLKIFHLARATAFTPGESASLLAIRPYHLRHAAVSTWLNAGVPAPQVAEWAGHSVDVLLRVYAKCVYGQQHEAKRRIEEATRPRDDE